MTRRSDFTPKVAALENLCDSVVVTLEDLEALDLMLWYGSGPRAAHRLHCNQSTVSRRLQRCLGSFGLRLRRREGGWVIQGNALLLQMEREIHQMARLLGRHPLRLEGFPGGSHLLLHPTPPGWAQGPNDATSVRAPLALLRDRVIDAWLTAAAEDLPAAPDCPLVVWPLAEVPIVMAADSHHPLVGEHTLTLSDLARFPIPIVPQQDFPCFHARCAELGLGTDLVTMRRYDPERWEGRTADGLTLVHTNPLNACATPQPSLVTLDSVPLFPTRLALVCRADVSVHGPVQELFCLLQTRLQHLQPRLPQLESIVLVR